MSHTYAFTTAVMLLGDLNDKECFLNNMKGSLDWGVGML